MEHYFSAVTCGSLEDSRSLRSPQLGPIRRQSGRSLLPLLCDYFEVIWSQLKAARRLANSANQKPVLKTRDISTLTGPSPPSRQRRLQSPFSARFQKRSEQAAICAALLVFRVPFFFAGRSHLLRLIFFDGGGFAIGKQSAYTEVSSERGDRLVALVVDR